LYSPAIKWVAFIKETNFNVAARVFHHRWGVYVLDKIHTRPRHGAREPNSTCANEITKIVAEFLTKVRVVRLRSDGHGGAFGRREDESHDTNRRNHADVHVLYALCDEHDALVVTRRVTDERTDVRVERVTDDVASIGGFRRRRGDFATAQRASRANLDDVSSDG
jgi:hypothetical protein